MSPDHPTLPISVIIPAYQAANTIARALDSIVVQTMQPAEVIVIDDGSQDATLEIAKSYSDPLKPFKISVLHQKNQGAGAARNLGLRKATQTFVSFLDADDEWLVDKLEHSSAYLKEQHYAIIAHDVLVDDGTMTASIDCSRHYQPDRDLFHELYRRGFVSTSTAIVNRRAALAAGGFDTSLPNAQDFDLWLAILKTPDAKLVVFPGAYTHHHVTRGSIQSFTERRLTCCLRIAMRYAPDLKAHPGSQWFSFWFRLLAVHYECMVSHHQNKRFFSALWTACRFPVTMFRLSFQLITRLNQNNACGR
jgi:glycosyltransferase involved in cell wall biosynthesis